MIKEVNNKTPNFLELVKFKVIFAIHHSITARFQSPTPRPYVTTSVTLSGQRERSGVPTGGAV